MKNFIKALAALAALGIFLGLSLGAQAQQANNYWCNSATVPCPPSGWTPASAANPFPVTGTFTPSGTQAVNVTQVLGTAISATNGLYTNLLQGNAALSTSNPIFMTGIGTAGSAAANPVTVQGIASMTPILTTQSANADPCSASANKTNVAISMQNSTTVKLVALSSAKQIYVCSLSLIASGATVFSVADGTKVSTECDTAAEAVIGAAVASHGLSLAANGGISFGSGSGTVARTITAAHDLCLFQSGSVDLSGNITYVQQ